MGYKMESAIVPDDYVLVNKLAYGAQLFDLSSAVEGKAFTNRHFQP